MRKENRVSSSVHSNVQTSLDAPFSHRRVLTRATVLLASRRLPNLPFVHSSPRHTQSLSQQRHSRFSVETLRSALSHLCCIVISASSLRWQTRCLLRHLARQYIFTPAILQSCMDGLAPSSMHIGSPLLALLCDLGFGGDPGFGRPFQRFLPGQGFVMRMHGIDGCIYRLASRSRRKF